MSEWQLCEGASSSGDRKGERRLDPPASLLASPPGDNDATISSDQVCAVPSASRRLRSEIAWMFSEMMRIMFCATARSRF